MFVTVQRESGAVPSVLISHISDSFLHLAIDVRCINLAVLPGAAQGDRAMVRGFVAFT